MASPAEFCKDGRVIDAIVAILGCRWPLSLKSVYHAVARDYAIKVSYQAVHKALKQLVEKGIVVKENREYCLNIDWIRKVKCFGANLEQAYTNGNFNEKIQQIV